MTFYTCIVFICTTGKCTRKHSPGVDPYILFPQRLFYQNTIDNNSLKSQSHSERLHITEKIIL